MTNLILFLLVWSFFSLNSKQIVSTRFILIIHLAFKFFASGDEISNTDVYPITFLLTCCCPRVSNFKAPLQSRPRRNVGTMRREMAIGPRAENSLVFACARLWSGIKDPAWSSRWCRRGNEHRDTVARRDVIAHRTAHGKHSGIYNILGVKGLRDSGLHHRERVRIRWFTVASHATKLPFRGERGRKRAEDASSALCNDAATLRRHFHTVCAACPFLK